MPLLRPFLTASLYSCLALVGAAQVQWLSSLDAARSAAAERQVPVYLCIGDPLNELTGAMHTQTFANAETAAFLNAHYICVSLDREAVPGLAAYGQQWLAAEQKLAGWPLNLWFTPDLAPIEAASYLPPTEEWGREGFMVVAGRIAERWTANAEAVRKSAQTTQAAIADYVPFPAAPVADLPAALATAATDWLALLDATHGTFGDPPHRLDPELIRFLLARGGDARRAALQALKVRLGSAVRDPIDGGYYRATADAAGGIPVFQKRLTDQARIALACLDAAQLDPDPIFPAGARSALDYAVNRLSPGDGTFIVGEDATTGAATATQTWSWDELTTLVGADTATALGATQAGNVDANEDLEGHHAGRNILHASPLVTAPRSVFERRAKILQARDERGATRIQTTATAGAHGLMLLALERAATELHDLDYGAYVLALRSALQRDFGVGTDHFTRLAHAPTAAAVEDYVLVGLGLHDDALLAAADTRFYDAANSLYHATVAPVLGLRPWWWKPAAGDLPAPGAWRLWAGHPPAGLAAEVAAPFDNPDAPPPGEVLLALQATLTP